MKIGDCVATVNQFGYPLYTRCLGGEYHDLHDDIGYEGAEEKATCYHHTYVPYSPFRELVDEVLGAQV